MIDKNDFFEIQARVFDDIDAWIKDMGMRTMIDREKVIAKLAQCARGNCVENGVVCPYLDECPEFAELGANMEWGETDG